MNVVVAKKYNKISLGRQGESNATQIRFDILDMVTALGDGEDGVFEIIVSLPQSMGQYLAGSITRNGNYLLWTITSEDTQYYGEGECEVVYSYNGRSMSIIYKTMILESLGNEESPETSAGMGWFDRAMAAKTSVDEGLATVNAKISEADAKIDEAQDLLDNVEENVTAIATAASNTAISAAESWAVGGTGTRTGEDTDNSKYYAEESKATFADILTALGGFRFELNGTDNSVKLKYDSDNASGEVIG